MRKFLDNKGALARRDFFPDEPDKRMVDAFEQYGVGGPNPDAPRVSLTQTFKGKWNKEVVDLLTTAFITDVKKGAYQPVQHNWTQMTEDNVRKRCQSKLYRTQYICRTGKRPYTDKVARMYQRRQEVCLLIGASHLSLTFP